jgi:malate synthase
VESIVEIRKSSLLQYISAGVLDVAAVLHHFINDEVLPGTGIESGPFWSGLGALIRDLTPMNRALLETRADLQREIDRWHHEQTGEFNSQRYRELLQRIGYLKEDGADCGIATADVDPEIANICGPQLVVPLDNARYALNAANARWVSLYDALYGTDAIPRHGNATLGGGYDPVRGAEVVTFVRHFLDRHFPLTESTHREVSQYSMDASGLLVRLANGNKARLSDASAAVGYRGPAASPCVVLLVHHGLHVELHIDRKHLIGRQDLAGICDVVVEAAVTTIQDCEDSVAAVDAEDKVRVYRNWLGLMKGTLAARFIKGDKEMIRRLNPDREYRAPNGGALRLPGRSLMLVRNVGHFMMTDSVTLNGEEVPEALLDAAVTALIALHDLSGRGSIHNSRTGSVYIVKPKMHGADEVAFADQVFARVENLLELPRYTLKMGIMDEERRTTVNLKACIRAARHRVVFINTGFLDRTGDEIHTAMEAGPVVRKNDMKKATWLAAYERHNVAVGLACGLEGRAQIGKGMWAMPDRMAEMMKVKVGQLLEGASTAWVPSPTAAALHALHYHEVNVRKVQETLKGSSAASLDDLLTLPTADGAHWSTNEVQEELNNNLQSILGYVVRWIDLGIGCSKVLNFYDVALMEDRATLRISAQHVANWLRHGICTKDQVERTLRSMAAVVDAQNAGDPAYRAMAPDFETSVAFLAAHELVFEGRRQPNGYTEAILHRRRRMQKLQAGRSAQP